MINYADTTYELIHAGSLPVLADEVNARLSKGKGWQASGGVTVVPGLMSPTYVQAVVRRRVTAEAK